MAEEENNEAPGEEFDGDDDVLGVLAAGEDVELVDVIYDLLSTVGRLPAGRAHVLAVILRDATEEFRRNAAEEFAQADEVSTSTPSPQHGEETLDPNEASPPDKANASDLPDIAATATATPSSATNAPDVPVDEEVRESQRELDQKLVAKCIRTFTGLYFSHTGDITRSLQARHDAGDETLKHLPLWRLVDKRYWFNRHLIAPFVQAGVRSLSRVPPSLLERH